VWKKCFELFFLLFLAPLVICGLGLYLLYISF
jgi:hypothetical protein